ncbi:hypothetical protein HK405_015959 [Cladochytrium tenue]|nr:hypothetical protein HK405_015959 [Cladochytrium tenue]
MASGIVGAASSGQRRANGPTDRSIRMFALRTCAFLVAFLVKWLVPTINRLYLLWMPSSFILFTFQAFLISTGSLLNALIYFGFDTLFACVERRATASHRGTSVSSAAAAGTAGTAHSTLNSNLGA